MTENDFPIIDSEPKTAEEYLDKARRIVLNHYNAPFVDAVDPLANLPLTLEEVYIVWFSKVLKNWKALVSTDVNDGLYYEVTYNGEKKETYLDVYGKISNTVIPDN